MVTMHLYQRIGSPEMFLMVLKSKKVGYTTPAEDTKWSEIIGSEKWALHLWGGHFHFHFWGHPVWVILTYTGFGYAFRTISSHLPYIVWEQVFVRAHSLIKVHNDHFYPFWLKSMLFGTLCMGHCHPYWLWLFILTSSFHMSYLVWEKVFRRAHT